MLSLALLVLAATSDAVDPPAELLGAAVQASEKGDYCAALSSFAALNERWPSSRAIYNAAEVAYAAGDRARALELYREAQRLYPDFEKKDAVQRRANEVFQRMVSSGPGTACPVSAATCGDWRITPGEACDDGNAEDGDGCDGNCLATACGNARLTAGEQCDDGNAVDGDGCDHTCATTACGNGVKTPGEQCDDGNAVDGDGCDHGCSLTACGNGVRSAGEQCDDGNGSDGDGCDRGCLVSRCGNGVQAAGEVCDDGNDRDGDGCESSCVITRRAAPVPGIVTASLGALSLLGAGALVAAGLQPWFEHEAAIDDLDVAAAQLDLAAADDARERELQTRNAWQSGGVLAVGAGGALAVLSAGAVAAGVTWALFATEEVGAAP